MKKLTIIIAAIFLFMGTAHAQNVFYAGNGNGTGKIWKNDSLIQSINDTLFVHLTSLQVMPDETLYTAGYAHDTGFNLVQGRVWIGDSILFNAGNSTAINALHMSNGIWTAAGFVENEWENVAGLVWQNGDTLYAYSDSVFINQINAIAVDTVTGDIYSGGISTELESKAAVWKNDTLLWREDSISFINAVTFDGSDLYAVGSLFEDEQYLAALWQNNTIVFTIPSVDSEFDAIAIYDGSIYLAGYVGDTLYIWQDEEVIYSHPFEEASKISALVVNEWGVYYAGQFEGTATVWKDGEILYQPEDCETIVGLSVMMPTPPLPEFVLTVEADTTGWGTVTGGGSYHYGDTATIQAFPIMGCEFLYWNDSITDNPLSVVVTQDSTFVASFARIPYTIEVIADHPEWGSVSGGGTYYYGDTIQIEAIPNLHYSFVGWMDSITDNPRTVIVTGNQTYTAQFDITLYHITTQAIPAGAGLVEGWGYYPYGDTVSLVAISNIGYSFEQWEDGETEPQRLIVVESDSTFTALFSAIQYEVSVECDPEEGGSVFGAGFYEYGSTAVLKVTPNENYMFLCWSDGLVSNPRNVLVTQDVHFKALFYLIGTPTYTITVDANDPNLGEVSGSGTYPEGATIEISATPFEDVIFRSWDDGNTDNPRSITVTQDMIFTAIFEYTPPTPTYTIIVRPENALLGSTYGSGTYPLNERVTIGAEPHQGYYFSGWQDGNADNPRSIIVTGNAEYIASFAVEPILTYTVTVQYDEEQGYVIGAGTYNAGASATLAAIPNDGYYFVKWGDNINSNPREIIVDHDIVLSAFFNHVGVDENGETAVILYPNPVNDKLHIEGLEDEAEIGIYNVYGVCIRKQTVNGSEEISLNDLAAGLYLLRINGGQTLKFVKR